MSHYAFIVRGKLGRRAGLLFLHGTLEDQDKEALLRKESDVFGDILQGDFPDTRPFLSHKVIMSFIWVNK